MYQLGTNRYIKTEQSQPEKWILIIVSILLGMLSMNFMSRFYYIAFILFGAIVVIYNKNFIFPAVVIPAFILSVSICFFSPNSGEGVLEIIKPFTYPFCVLIGYTLVNVCKEKEKQAMTIILVLASGAYCHYLLNMIYNLGRGMGRNTLDFWTQSILSATGQASFAYLMIGVSVSMLFYNTKIFIKALAFGILISIAVYNLTLGGRSIFVLIILMIIGNSISILVTKRGIEKKLKILLWILLLIAIFAIVIHYNIFGITETIQNSNYYNRFYAKYGNDGLYEDGRMRYKNFYLQNMYLYPFGGHELKTAANGNYAHDLLLDAYSDSGIITFIALVFMLWITITKSYSIICKKDISINAKSLIVNVFFSLFFLFSMEPILEGLPWLLASFCIIYGSVAGLAEYYKRQ